jgi:alpha-beta hydrolase superfamily lysophospholipase
MQRQEGTFTASDGVEIFHQSWLPDGSPRAVLLLVHGLGDHSGRYRNVIDYFVPKGFAIYALDLRGHGRSGGARGHTPGYDRLLDDMGRLFARVREAQPDKRIFIYGHSMGGNLVLNYALRRGDGLSGVIAASPWLILPHEPPAALVALSKILARVAPALTLSNQLKVADISRDADVVAAYVNDPLVHDRISSKMYNELANAAAWALEHAAEMKRPTLLIHGGDDHITWCEGTRLFHERAATSIYHRYDGLYHETHHEPERENVFRDIERWLEERI